MSQQSKIPRLLAISAAGATAVLLLGVLWQSAVFAITTPPLHNTSDMDESSWVINEFLADPADDLRGDANGDGFRSAIQDEFIEIVNNSGAPADISGWTLADGSEVRHTFPAGTLVPDQCTVVVFGGGTPTGSFGNAIVQIASNGRLGLDNNGDTISLNPSSTAPISLTYGFEADDDQSLTRDPDISGGWFKHSLAGGGSGSLYSPGTKLNGRLFSGCPGADDPPMVLSTNPPADAVDVLLDQSIAIIFSEPVQLGNEWFEITCSASGDHQTAINGSEAVYTVDPLTDFTAGETCTARIIASQVNDLDGAYDPMVADYLWSFTTAEPLDSAPQIMGTTPQDGAENVALSETITITFSEPVTSSASAFQLSCSGSGIHPLTISGGPETFTLDPLHDLANGETCSLTVLKDEVNDLDQADPPDHMLNDFSFSFTTLVATQVLINEVDADTPGSDTAEFIELFDGGLGGTPLSGLVVVLFNGQDDLSYQTYDLNGYHTNVRGYFLLGNAAVPGVDLVFADNILQNGVDAVALYRRQVAEFPRGSPVSSDGLLDALVYGSGDEDDSGLLTLLLPGEPQVDENGQDFAQEHSNQRCPNGSGGGRTTTNYKQDLPTPKSSNRCVVDSAPFITAIDPPAGADDVPLSSSITITFSEEVTVSEGWAELSCTSSGLHTITESKESLQIKLLPVDPFTQSENCTVSVKADKVSDLDEIDPPDLMVANYAWSFTTAGGIAPPPILINEVDADTEGADTLEFIELYDGGTGQTNLDGLTVVFFNGASDLSYLAISLESQSTDALGYFLLGNAAVPAVDRVIPDGTLQNGPDAVAIYAAPVSAFPSGSAVTTTNLIDALVYDTNDDDDEGLLSLLLDGQPQVNEAGRENPVFDSNQRCPNGSGSQRDSTTFLQNLATPGSPNKCTFDAAPSVDAVSPPEEAVDIEPSVSIAVTFSEAVQVDNGWYSITCDNSGDHLGTTTNTGSSYYIQPLVPFDPGETCSVAIIAGKVSDLDSDDPPDTMAVDKLWRFSTKPRPLADHMLINEVDADTEGSDTLEFIELFDGGLGQTSLYGLVIVLYNGSDDQSYRAIDLDGWETDGSGYLVIGNGDVNGVDIVIPNGSIQNGADAVALYAASAIDFPNGTPVTRQGLLDALVYDTDDAPDPELLTLLPAGQPQVNEAGEADEEHDSNQRCPNGEGGQLATAVFRPNPATPGSPNDCSVDLPPRITSTTPPAGATQVDLDTSLTIKFNEAVKVNASWFTISCTVSGEHPAAASGGPMTFILDPVQNFEPRESCTVTIFKTQVRDRDGRQKTMADDYRWTFHTGLPAFGKCGDPHTPISAVQGENLSSPAEGLQGMILQGVVTGDFRDKEKLGGYFLQDVGSGGSSHSLASAGIFIHDPEPGEKIEVGRLIRLQGDVLEIDHLSAITNVVHLLPCQAGVAITPTVVTLPVNDSSLWEQYEGMLVAISQTLVVADNSEWGRQGMVTLTVGDRQFYPTETITPGQAAQDEIAIANRHRIALDDGRSTLYPQPLPPYGGPQNTLRVGDTLNSLTGVLSEDAEGYRIHPTTTIHFTHENDRPELLLPAIGQLRIAGFHLDNYFNGNGQGGGFPAPRGPTTAAEFARQRAKILSAIRTIHADVLAVTGLENDGFSPDSALLDLVQGLNEAAPAGTSYAAIDPGQTLSGSEESAVGFIYRQETVQPSGPALSTSDPPFEKYNRSPLVQAFSEKSSDEVLVIALNQFQDRDDCPEAGAPNSDQGDGQGCWNLLRAQAADYLANWLEANPLPDPDPDLLILGLLNAYALEDPLLVLRQAGYHNLVDQFAASSAYSSITYGFSGTMFHALASPSLTAQVKAVTQWHINADEPQALDYREQNQAALFQPDAYRSAADDPLIIDLRLDSLQASFQARSPVPIGQPVVFTNTSSGSGELAYSWDFGDGSDKITELHPTHTYKTIGSYTVTLTVKAPWGETAVAQATVTVNRMTIYFPFLARKRPVPGAVTLLIHGK